MKKLIVLCGLLLVFVGAGFADNFIYGNNATGGSPYIYKIDKTTGAIVTTYSGLSGINGRGVVVVGNTMYYTDANDNHVYTFDLATNTNTGTAFTVTGASALSTIAYDGTNFWVGDYSGTNQAFLYTPTGTLLKTVTLQNCGGFCDGLEYVVLNGQARLISNREDAVGPYDLYDTNGNLITANFITPASSTTGIAFDGTNFFTSDIFNGTLSEWDVNGAFVKTFGVTGGNPLIEDLSADYSQVLPPPTTTPEPSSLLILGTGLLGVGVLRRKFSI